MQVSFNIRRPILQNITLPKKWILQYIFLTTSYTICPIPQKGNTWAPTPLGCIAVRVGPLCDALINSLGTQPALLAQLAQLGYKECFHLRHKIEGLGAQEYNWSHCELGKCFLQAWFLPFLHGKAMWTVLQNFVCVKRLLIKVNYDFAKLKTLLSSSNFALTFGSN